MLFALLGLSLLIYAPSVTAFCYWLDGPQASDYSPCYALNSVGASMCCDGADGFNCVEGGLCKSTPLGPVGSYDNGSSYWRGPCSDNTWQDPACLAMAPWITNNLAQLGICADGTFCPRTQTGPNTTCCNDHQGQKAANSGATIAAGVVSSIQAVPTRTSSTTSVTSATSVSSGTSTAGSGSSSTSSTVTRSTASGGILGTASGTASGSSSTLATTSSAPPSASTSSANPSPATPSNNVWIAGAALGSIFAIALAIAAFLLIRKRKQRSGRNLGPGDYDRPELDSVSMAKTGGELHGVSMPRRGELQASEAISARPLYEM